MPEQLFSKFEIRPAPSTLCADSIQISLMYLGQYLPRPCRVVNDVQVILEMKVAEITGCSDSDVSALT